MGTLVVGATPVVATDAPPHGFRRGARAVRPTAHLASLAPASASVVPARTSRLALAAAASSSLLDGFRAIRPKAVEVTEAVPVP